MFLLYTSYPYVVFLIIFLVFGFIGNIFVCVLVSVLKEYKKSVTHLYILQLTIADFFFLGFIPFLIIDEINDGVWGFGNGMCKAIYGIRYINYYASILFMTVMSMDRYIAVCQSSSDTLRKLRTPTSSIIISSAVWLISVSLSIPIMYFAQTEGEQPDCVCQNKFLYDDELHSICLEIGGYTAIGEYYCNYTHPLDDGRCRYGPIVLPDPETFDYRKGIKHVPLPPRTPSGHGLIYATYVWFNFIGMFIIPILLMSVCYGLIVKKFRSDSLISGSTMQREGGISHQQRLTLVCITLVATFLLCWITHHIFWIEYLYTGDFDGHFDLARNALPYLNSALNPYLYSFLGPGFLRKWRSFRAQVCRRPITSAQSNTTNAISANRFRIKTGKGSKENQLSRYSNSKL